MEKETPLINILTYRLPYVLSNQIFNEYQSRLKEATVLIEKYKKYQPLRNDMRVIESFLSLSIFHRRIITNFDGVVKFYGTVCKTGQTGTIKIGNYNLTGAETNKIRAVVISYNKMLEKFSVQPGVMEYYETRDLLKKLITLKSGTNNGEVQEKQQTNKGKGNIEEDFSF